MEFYYSDTGFSPFLAIFGLERHLPFTIKITRRGKKIGWGVYLVFLSKASNFSLQTHFGLLWAKGLLALLGLRFPLAKILL